MTIDETLKEVYTGIVDIDPKLSTICIAKEYFVAVINYYNKNSVPVTSDGVRVDKPESYILIDTTKNIREFKDAVEYESFAQNIVQRFAKINKYHSC